MTKKINLPPSVFYIIVNDDNTFSYLRAESMNYIFMLIVIILFSTNFSYGQWPNPENQMLSDSISSFFHYSTKDNKPFADPGSLRDTNRRSELSDKYHDESEYILEQVRQQRLREQQFQQRFNPYYQNTTPNYYYQYNPKYKLHYLHRKQLKQF